MADNPNTYYKYLNFIFAGMLLSTLIFLGISAFLIITSGHGVFDEEDQIIRTLEYVLLGSIIFFIPTGILLHKRSLSRLENQPLLHEKLKGYTISLIIKLALVELVCYLNIIILLLSGKYFLALPLIILILYIVQNRPSVERISQELNLSHHDKEKLTG